jgi:hypothetical protein
MWLAQRRGRRNRESFRRRDKLSEHGPLAALGSIYLDFPGGFHFFHFVLRGSGLSFNINFAGPIIACAWGSLSREGFSARQYTIYNGGRWSRIRHPATAPRIGDLHSPAAVSQNAQYCRCKILRSLLLAYRPIQPPARKGSSHLQVQ